MLTEVYKGAPNTPELYVPQRHMLEAVEAARESGISSCYVDVATGVGKTYATAHDIKKYLDQKPDARVLYLCHKGQVLEQARETIADLLSPQTTHGNFYGGKNEGAEQIVYATFQAMAAGGSESRKYEEFDPKEFDYIVVDESHHGPAPTYSEVIEYFEPDFQIGLTATDERMDGKDISEVLGPKVFEYTLEEAIAEGVLVKPDYRLFTEHEADLKDLLVDDDMPPTLKEINDRLTRVQRDRNYQQAIVGEIQAAQAEHDQPRTVIYCPDIQYAEDFSEQIPEGETLHSGLSDEEQDARLKAFRRGDIPTLLVVDIFNEGIDVPEINTMVFLRGTESKMIFLQQLGRGLRTAEGKEKVIALDFAASWQRIMLIAELKEKVQTIYQERGPYKKSNKNKNSRHEREYFDSEDMVPFDFNFSKDALDAVNIVEKIRKEKAKPKKVKNKESWTEKWNNADRALQEMFGLNAFDPKDPDNQRNLPDQRMTMVEEQTYARKIALGDKDAQQQYIMRRLRYVYTKALNEHSKQPDAGVLSVEDYFQKGLEELVVLLSEYDIDKYKKHPDIRVYIAMKLWNTVQRLSANESAQIRVPIYILEKVKKVRAAQEEYMETSATGELPTDLELAELMKGELNVEEIVQARPWVDMLDNGLDVIEDMSDISGDTTATIIEEASESLISNSINRLFGRLSPDERHVLVNRYGLGGDDPKSAMEIARGSGMTAARVREIENTALKRLCQDPETGSIHTMFDDISETDFLSQNTPPSQYQISLAKRRLATDFYWSDNGGKESLQSFVRTWGNQKEPEVAGNAKEHPFVVEFNHKKARARKIIKIWEQHKQRFDEELARQEREYRRRKDEERVRQDEKKARQEEFKREVERRKEERKKQARIREIEKKVVTAEKHYDWLEQNLDSHELVAARSLYNKLIEDLQQELREINQTNNSAS